MEFRQMRTFATVARLLSFNRAADELNYSQSTVSSQIMALEQEFGVPLFERLGRRIRLTEPGQRLVPYATRVLEIAEEAKSDVTGQSSRKGALSIRVPESFAVHRLSPIIGKYRERHPGVRLHFLTCTHEGLKKDLRKGIVDLAFLFTDSFQEPDLQVEKLENLELSVVASANHPLAKMDKITLKDLQGQTLFLSRADCSYRRLFERKLQVSNVKVDGPVEVNSVAAIKQFVVDGDGISILPDMALDASERGADLVRLNLVEEILEVACLMIVHKEKWISPALADFMTTVRDSLNQGAAID